MKMNISAMMYEVLEKNIYFYFAGLFHVKNVSEFKI